MIIFLMIGAAAIFIWSQLSAKKPVEKTEVLESPLPEPKDIMDVFKENAPKIAAIVAGSGAAVKVATTILPAARVLPTAVTEMLPGAGIEGASKIGVSAGGASGSGVLPTIGGAALVLSPIVIVPLVAKFLDFLWPNHVVTPEEQAAMDAAHTFRAEVAAIPGVQLVKGEHAID